MKQFEAFNPAVTFVYYMLTAGIAMFCLNPVVSGISLAGALIYLIMNNRAEGFRFHIFCALLLILGGIVNPVMYHNGKTVLFILNDNPVTLEAFIYGMSSSLMIVNILYWFRSFSRIMTSDRLLYVFGRLFPKFALIFSMALRYIPLFGRQIAKTNAAQKALGLYREDNAIDAIRGGSRVFSVMVTWALENGCITADSMAARGYGIGKRSFFEIYGFSRRDRLLLASELACALVFIVFAAGGKLTCAFYPEFVPAPLTFQSVAAYTAYTILCFIPSAIDTGERIIWHYLKSEI